MASISEDHHMANQKIPLWSSIQTVTHLNVSKYVHCQAVETLHIQMNTFKSFVVYFSQYIKFTAVVP